MYCYSVQLYYYSSTAHGSEPIRGRNNPTHQEEEENDHFEHKSEDFNLISLPRFFLGLATKTELPAGVLYRVQATYRYDKEDPDELSFEIGESINVIEYDDPEDQVRIPSNSACAW